MSLLAAMPSAAVQADIVSHNAATSACDKAGEWNRALNALNAMTAVRTTPDVISCNAAMSACATCEWPWGLAILRSMSENLITADTVSYNVSVGASGSGGRWQFALRLLDLAPAESLGAGNAVMASCSETGEWRTVIALLRKTLDARTGPDKFSYAAAIGACKEASKWNVVLLLLDCMGVVRVSSDIPTCNAAISTCHPIALRVLQAMLDTGLAPDVISYNAAISACETQSDWVTAGSLLRELQDRGLQINAVTCSATVGILGKAGCWRKALDLQSCFKSLASVISCSALATSCERRCCWKKAFDVISSYMPSIGLRQSLFSHGVLLSASARRACWLLSLEILDNLQRDDLAPDAACRNAAISACEKRGQLKRGRMILVGGCEPPGASDDMRSFLWALARLEFRDAAVVHSAAAKTLIWLRGAVRQPSEVSMLAWALAMLGIRGQTLFSVLAKQSRLQWPSTLR